jgi:hypothetical protein
MSVLKFCAVIGFGSGIFMGLLFLVSGIQSGQTASGIIGLVLAPLFSALGNVVTGLLGYPFYSWYCDRVKGQPVSGKFLEIAQDDKNEA